MLKKIILVIIIVFLTTKVSAEPLVVVVNKNNPVSSLSMSEVQRVFLLEVTNWPTGNKIQPINRNKQSKVKSEFTQHILNMSPEDYHLYWIRVKQLTGKTEPKSVRSNKFVIKLVMKNKNAIGYLPKKYLDGLNSTSKSKIKTVFKFERD